MAEDTAAEWLERAEEDLRVARLSLEADPPLLRPSLFHAQQAGEKALKGLLVRAGLPSPPKTHSVETLLDLCLTENPGLGERREDALLLSPYAVEPRYPGDVDRDRVEAEDAITAAERLVHAVAAILGEGEGK